MGATGNYVDVVMTCDEAKAQAQRLSREHPDRDHYHWFAKHIDGQVWTVVQVPRPVSLARPAVAGPADG